MIAVTTCQNHCAVVLGELKRLLGQLESEIRDQLKKRTGTQLMKQRSPNAVAKARDLADQEIDKLSDQSATAEERQERQPDLDCDRQHRITRYDGGQIGNTAGT